MFGRQCARPRTGARRSRPRLVQAVRASLWTIAPAASVSSTPSSRQRVVRPVEIGESIKEGVAVPHGAFLEQGQTFGQTVGVQGGLGGEAIFVAGRPLCDIWGASGLRWQRILAAAIPTPLRHPHLRLVRNDRHPFDLDNLAYPVLAASGCATCESVWASVAVGPVEGVWVSEEVPPPPPSPPVSVSVRIQRPSTASVAERLPAPGSWLAAQVVAVGCNVGLSLEFDSPDVAVGEMSYEGPTKSLIDDLGPLLGWRPYRGRMVSADDRVKELRVTRGHRPGDHGVLVTVWRLDT